MHTNKKIKYSSACYNKQSIIFIIISIILLLSIISLLFIIFIISVIFILIIVFVISIIYHCGDLIGFIAGQPGDIGKLPEFGTNQD